jgi:2-(1,2-epoxy-1,2-dihydrophenyl)acetyl-CoA isomerase
MSFEYVSLEKNESIVTIILNRPDSLNALNIPLAEELWDALEECDREDKIRVVIIRAAGRAFCAGGDVKGMKDSLDKDPPTLLKRLTRPAHGIVLAIRNLQKPVIAQVHGMASGAGFSLALACDFIIASKSAQFNLAYSNIGLSPDLGSSLFLPKLIGLQRASEMFLTGRIIDAEEGLRMGFVNQVVPDEKINETTFELAMCLAQRPPLALAKTKALINQSLFRGLEAQLEAERMRISESAGTEDFREGLKAFFEKRPPTFCGR